jgi:hypothetical protein
MPAAVLPALRFLEEHTRCAVSELPDCMDDESKLVLVRRLLAEGIVDSAR